MGQPVLVAMIAQMLIHQGRQLQPQHQPDQQRDVIDPFMGQEHVVDHTAECTTKLFFLNKRLRER
jgi:hypothetical protein